MLPYLEDIYCTDFPGETFSVLKEKEEKQYGEYRTRRLVLKAWDNLKPNDRVYSIYSDHIIMLTLNQGLSLHFFLYLLGEVGTGG